MGDVINIPKTKKIVLTLEIINDLIDIIVEGVPTTRAALSLGIDEDRWKLWLRRGKDDYDRRAYTIYRQLYENVNQAESIAIVNLVTLLKQNADNSSRVNAYKWMLSKLDKENFGDDKSAMNVGGNMTHKIILKMADANSKDKKKEKQIDIGEFQDELEEAEFEEPEEQS